MQDRALRLLVETLHVDQSAIAGRHQHRNPAGTGAFAQYRLHVERVTLFDHDVEAV